MRRIAAVLAVFLTAFVGSPVFAQPDMPAGPAGTGVGVAAVAPDLLPAQSPARPQPEWLTPLSWFGVSWPAFTDQGQRDPRLKGYVTPAGVQVDIVAEHPVVTNPLALTFGDGGTPLVLEWRPDPSGDEADVPQTLVYRDGSRREFTYTRKCVPDPVKVLRDSKGLGTFDEPRVVLEDSLPGGLMLADGWLYLAGQGSVRRYRASQPGGPFDIKRTVLQGFGGSRTRQASGLALGPGGWLYVTVGAGDHHVEGTDGQRATVLGTGAVFRCRPDGSRVQVFAVGFANPRGTPAFDAAGNLFVLDDDVEDGSKFTGCRLIHVTEGSDYGWRLAAGSTGRPDPVRAAAYGEHPGRLPPLLRTGRGSPAGLAVLDTDRFPTNFRGLVLHPDPLRKSVRAYRLEPRGATFHVTEEFELLRAEDELFRPIHVTLGPDGALYVADWRTAAGGVGRLGGDNLNGRIYRLSWTGTADEPALPLRGRDAWLKVVRGSDDELLRGLAAADRTLRTRARDELARRGPRNLAQLVQLLDDQNASPEARVAALDAAEGLWNPQVTAVAVRLLSDIEPDLRRLAADALARHAPPRDRDVQAALLAALADPDPAVRRSVALAMGELGADGAADALVTALAFDTGKDLVLRDGLVRGLERLGLRGLERLMALADSGVAKDLERVVEAFVAFRGRAAAEALPALLKNPHLTIAQRAALVRSFGNYHLAPPVSLRPALDYLRSHPDEAREVKLAGLEALAADGGLADEQGQAWALLMLDEADPALRPAVLHALEEGRVTRAVPRLAAWLTDAERPAGERALAARVLRGLGDRSCVPALKEALAGTRPADESLRLELFRTLQVLDPAAAEEAGRTLLTARDPALATEAVQAAGQQPAGARTAGELFLKGQLPRQLLPRVADVLRRHAAADPECARLLAAVLKTNLLVPTDPKGLERLRDLVARQGDPERGKALFLNTTTLACVTCHRLEGVGGHIGPDLTRIWETLPVDKVVEAMLEPSKEIKDGYATWVATTRQGRTHQGLKMSQNAAEVVLRDATGKDLRLAAGDVEELKPSPVSLMPDGVTAGLSLEQFLDLAAFLKSRAAQESLRGLVVDYLAAGPFGGDFRTAYPPETSPGQPAASYPGPRPGHVLTWQPVQAGPAGRLDLRTLGGDGPSTVYALAYVYSPKGQKAHLHLGSGETSRVWVGGRLVHEQGRPRPALPEQDRVAVGLDAGWNVVLVRLTRTAGDQAVTLRFVGDGLRTARQPRD